MITFDPSLISNAKLAAQSQGYLYDATRCNISNASSQIWWRATLSKQLDSTGVPVLSEPTIDKLITMVVGRLSCYPIHDYALLSLRSLVPSEKTANACAFAEMRKRTQMAIPSWSPSPSTTTTSCQSDSAAAQNQQQRRWKKYFVQQRRHSRRPWLPRCDPTIMCEPSCYCDALAALTMAERALAL